MVILKVMADADRIAVSLDDVPVAVVQGVTAVRVVRVRMHTGNIDCRTPIPA